MFLVPKALLLAATLCFGGDELDREQFERLHAELLPEEVADYESIPWRLDLRQARAEAKESGRLLFLWSMNGHPLGCT